MWKKGRLRKSDYFVIFALPCLFTGVGLLHSSLNILYALDAHPPHVTNAGPTTTPQLTVAIEILWITIYSTKLSILVQLSFNKPLYAYVAIHLTRYYWVVVSVCSIAFVFTIAVPIILLPYATQYFRCSIASFPWLTEDNRL
jgi:hypothetical protein